MVAERPALLRRGDKAARPSGRTEGGRVFPPSWSGGSSPVSGGRGSCRAMGSKGSRQEPRPPLPERIPICGRPGGPAPRCGPAERLGIITRRPRRLARTEPGAEAGGERRTTPSHPGHSHEARRTFRPSPLRNRLSSPWPRLCYSVRMALTPSCTTTPLAAAFVVAVAVVAWYGGFGPSSVDHRRVTLRVQLFFKPPRGLPARRRPRCWGVR